MPTACYLVTLAPREPAMARRASVRYWKSRKAYCTTINGKQVVLCEGEEDFPDGECYTTALHKFAELVGGKPRGMTVQDVADRFVLWCRHHRAAETTDTHRRRLAPIVSQFGGSPCSDLTAYALEHYCDQQRAVRGWNDSTVALTLKCVNAALNWSVRSGLLETNPLKGLETPTVRSRGLDCVLTDAQADAVLASCKGATKDLVTVLRCTGCRPAELRRAEATNYDAALNALVFSPSERRSDKRHKTARTGKSRVVYLSGAATEVVRRLVERHPSGPLFRSPQAKRVGPHRGQRWAWTRNGIVEAMMRLSVRTGIAGLCAMSFRHSYAVRWLRANKPIAALAEILGTSIQMIVSHYGHLASQHDYLRRLVDE